MKRLTEEWIMKAEGDLTVVDSQMRETRPVADVVCFLCQQCVEKYLKAWLTEQDISFPRTHDLEALAKLSLPSMPELAAHLHDLRYLTTFAVEVRYPGLSAQTSDAERSARTAHAIRALVRAKLGL
jgi:HEPN domain-containing protein